MRIALVILFLWSLFANATTYYVSNAGNNNNVGSQASPYATIAKAMSMVAANDIVLLNKGDTWNEKIIVPVSNLTIGSYGTGAKPLITGFQTVTVTSAGSNIWTATVAGPAYLNTVLVNGVIRAKGRYPNASYLGQNQSTSTQLNNSGLTGTPDYTGGEAVVRAAHWILNKSIISSQSGATLNLATTIGYTPISGYGFFIQNIPSVLDLVGEWCKPTSSNLFSVYATSQPTVQVATIDTLCFIKKKDYVTIDGLSFTGANMNAIRGDSSYNLTVKNTDMNYSGEDGFYAAFCKELTFQYNTVYNSLDNGTYISGGRNGLITDNDIQKSGIFAGMGRSGEAKYVGLYNGSGDFSTHDTTTVIKNNRIDSSGYMGIMAFSYYGSIYQNYITNFCFVKDDGGGIYAGWSGMKVVGNIVGYGIGAILGATGQVIAPGIYYDDNQNDNFADSNTVFNCVWASLFFHNNAHNSARDNLLIGTGGYPLYETEGSSYKNYQRNILYSTSSSYVTFNHNNISATDTINNNYYLRPTQETNKWTAGGTSYSSIASWRTATGYDANSSETPTGITTDAPLFIYNPTKIDSTIALTDNYIDAKSVSKSVSITLKPYTSTLLFKATPNPYSRRIIPNVKYTTIKRR